MLTFRCSCHVHVLISRSSHWRGSLEKGILKKFRKFYGKTSVSESLFKKVSGLKAYIFIKKRLQQKCFPVKFLKFLGTPISKNICERLLLKFENEPLSSFKIRPCTFLFCHTQFTKFESWSGINSQKCIQNNSNLTISIWDLKV